MNQMDNKTLEQIDAAIKAGEPTTYHEQVRYFREFARLLAL